MTTDTQARYLSFEGFRLDCRSGELRRNKREIRLQPQPAKLLVLLDRLGRQSIISSTERAYSDPIFSPDGRRIAIAVEQDVGAWAAFVIDVASGAWTRVADGVPSAWMPDGERLLLDGGPRLVTIDGSESPEMLYDMDASSMTVEPDGGRALFSTQAAPGNWDIWCANIAGEPGAAPWLATQSWEQGPSVSPDGSWVAYHSDESGRFEIQVRHYSGVGGKHQVSTHGGLFPRWSHDGTEILFANEGSLWSAAARTSSTFASDRPRALFELPEEIRVGGSQFYDVSPDGQHFVMVQKDPFELRPLDLVVVPGWIEEMKARLAAAK